MAKQIIKYLIAKIIDIVVILLCTNFGSPLIFQLLYNDNFKAYKQLVESAQSNPAALETVIQSPQYMHFTYSVVLMLLIAIILFIVLPLVIKRRPLGELLLRIDSLPSYPLWKKILLQPALWFILATNISAIIVCINIPVSQNITNVLQILVMTGAIFSFVFDLNVLQNGKQTSAPTKKPVHQNKKKRKPRVKPTKKHKK